MDTLDAIILGIIQGLTEFLPVSSSGHLKLGEALLGIQEGSMSFAVMVHAATVLSTLLVFRKDIREIVTGLFQGSKEQWQFAGMIVVSMIPAVVVGLIFDEQLTNLFEADKSTAILGPFTPLDLVGFCLLITAALLMFTSVAKSGDRKVGWTQAILIGLAQAFAILPGISRSGSTISMALYNGVDRAKAARFSFLMAIPVIMGGAAKDIIDLMSGEAAASSAESVSFGVLAVGFIAAFLAGWLACSWMLAIVKRGKLWHFAVYCCLAGIVAILV